jgi:nitrite reductase/ring-hydroxylating ferredoxin subunit
MSSGPRRAGLLPMAGALLGAVVVRESDAPVRVRVGPVTSLPAQGFVVVPLLPPLRLPDGTTARGAVLGRAGREGLAAYANVCRHLAIPLDLRDGNVMDSSGVDLLCHHHGAIFDAATGLCTFGPCAGRSLWRLGVEVVDGEIEIVVRVEAPVEVRRG